MVIVAACALAAAHTDWHSGVIDLGYGMAQTGAPILITLFAGRRLLRREGWIWLPITAFGLGLSIAQVGWTVLGYGSGPTTMGIWADQVYSAALPLGVIGLGGLAFSGLRSNHRWRVITDACVVATGLGLFGWVAFYDQPFLAGSLHHTGGGLIYPALDTVAAAIIVTASIYQPHRPRLVWLAAAVAMGGCSDALTVLQHTPATSTKLIATLLTMTWITAPLLITGGVLVDDRPHGTFGIGHERRSLVSLFVILGVISAAVAGIREGALSGPTLWIAVGLGTAAFVNQASVFHELRGVLSEHALTLAALTASEEEFRLTFEGAPVGIVVVDNGILRRANPTA